MRVWVVIFQCNDTIFVEEIFDSQDKAKQFVNKHSSSDYLTIEEWLVS